MQTEKLDSKAPKTVCPAVGGDMAPAAPKGVCQAVGCAKEGTQKIHMGRFCEEHAQRLHGIR